MKDTNDLLEDIQTLLTIIAEKKTFIELESRSHANPYGNEIENPFYYEAKDLVKRMRKSAYFN